MRRFRFLLAFALAAATLLIGAVFGVGAASATPPPPSPIDEMLAYSPPPPENLRVESEFLGTAKLSWDAVPRIGKYNLYRNGQYLLTIESTSVWVTAPVFEWDEDDYTVVSVNDFNERFSPQSDPVTLIGAQPWCSFEDEHGYYDGPCPGANPFEL